MAKDHVQEALEAAEKGKSGGTLREQRQVLGSEPVKRPDLFPKPVSKAPKGMGNAVKGDLGAYRQEEAGKVFKGLPGKSVSAASALPYRKPAIEGGMGARAV
jgi:hypothetical protein